MSDAPTFAGYTLNELEALSIERAAKRDNADVQDRYRRAAVAALPFLIARLRQLERRPRRSERTPAE